tara:strand:- start:725 stop:2098 length:1374 start_codon:yes stop_codon:yes gene_type:complete
MKNVIFWVGVKNQTYSEKYGGWDWMDISRKTWEYWCEKHDVIFFPMEKPINDDLVNYRINWQKSIYCFDLLDEAGIDYDQIFLVDATCMAKWDMPNIFELTDHKFTAWRERDNLRWVYDSIKGYEDFFCYDLNKYDYFSSGVIIFNKSHKDIFLEFKDLYLNNVDEFVDLQDKIVRKGTEQTPLNYWVQKNNVELNLDLPFSYKLTHIHRKDMFGYNWQLNEDNTPFFIKYGKNWVFNGIPKDQRTHVMKQIWDLVKHNYDSNHFLNKVKSKVDDKDTTSRKFKEDLITHFQSFGDKTLLELGCNRGHTTRVYASLFKKVIGVERSENNLKQAKENCSDVNNVEFIHQDVYDSNFSLPKADVVHVDAGHSHQEVLYDIHRCIEQLGNPILIFDDVCKKLFPNGEIGNTIRTAIDQHVEDGRLNIVKYIGEDKGYTTGNGKVLLGREGMICDVQLRRI